MAILDTTIFGSLTHSFDDHRTSEYILEKLEPDLNGMMIRLKCTFVLQHSTYCKCIGCNKEDVLILCPDCLDILHKRRDIANKLKEV